MTSSFSQADGFYPEEDEQYQQQPYVEMPEPQPLKSEIATRVESIRSIVDEIVLREYYSTIEDIANIKESITNLGQIFVYEPKFKGEKLDPAIHNRDNGYKIVNVGMAPKQKGFEYKGACLIKVLTHDAVDVYPIYELIQDDSQADGFNDKSGDYI